MRFLSGRHREAQWEPELPCCRRPLRYGISRGVFSNEAGLGAGGISAAAAQTDDPVRQGYISMTGVFVDTMVICLVTGLAVGVTGAAERDSWKRKKRMARRW